MSRLEIYSPTKQWRAQVIAALGEGPLETDATAGFIYVPSCDGIPTGTPADLPGFSAIAIDATNGDLYMYVGGGWVLVGP